MTRSDRQMLRSQLLDSIHDEPWEEVLDCPGTYEGACTDGTFKPTAITTVYSYDPKDAQFLKEACLENAGPNGSGAIWRWGQAL